MIVAGIGCRRDCPAEAIVTLVHRAMAETGLAIGALAAPEFKRDEPGLHGAAAALGLRILFVDQADLAAAQAGCVTSSEAALAATGLASIAEAAAIAASGGPLRLARIGAGQATCAVAGA